MRKVGPNASDSFHPLIPAYGNTLQYSDIEVTPFLAKLENKTNSKKINAIEFDAERWWPNAYHLQIQCYWQIKWDILIISSYLSYNVQAIEQKWMSLMAGNMLHIHTVHTYVPTYI